MEKQIKKIEPNMEDAAELFMQLSAREQEALIVMIKSLLSER